MACYYKANTKSSKTVPCNHTALDSGGHTQCCEPGDLCLTNGLCREETVNNETNYAWRFACTDPSFKDPACATAYCDFLKDSDTHLTWKCIPDKLWCCNTGPVAPFEDRANNTNLTCCTGNDRLLFTAENPTVFATASPYNTVFSIGTSLATSTPIANMTVSSASAISTSVPTSLSSAASVSAAPNSATSGVAAPSTRTSTLAVGLGAGFGSAAAIALGIITFCLLRRRKKRNAAAPISDAPAEELGSECVVEGNNEYINEMTVQDQKAELASPDSPFELWSPIVSAELPCKEKGQCDVNELDGTTKKSA